MAGLSAGIRPPYDGLQPLQPVEQTGGVASDLLRSDRFGRRCGGQVGLDRQHACQGAPVGWRRKRGAFQHAIGRSRGGRATKIHALCDGHGRPVAFVLTPGNINDITPALDLLAMIAPPDMLLADKAYDANRLRLWLDEQGAVAVIPSTTSRRAPIPCDTIRYKARNLIERMFCRLKDFRRIATRYDKRADIFLSAICIAAAISWWT